MKQFKLSFLTVLIFIIVALTQVSYSQTYEQIQKHMASDGSADDYFGYSSSLSGDILAVGAYFDDDKGTNSGSVYLFYKDFGGTDNWGEVKKITASDGFGGDEFGRSVCISGDYLIVGAYAKNNDQGAVYVFYRNHGGTDNWGEVKKMTASDGAIGHEFGRNVSISDTIAVVGAHSHESVYVFYKNHDGADNWGEVNILTASDGVNGDNFGFSVAVEDTIVVVGAYNNEAAYLFYQNKDGGDHWGEIKKIQASESTSGQSFGYSVDVFSDEIVVTTLMGMSAFVFKKDQGGIDNWGQIAKLTTTDAGLFSAFGFSAEITDKEILIGCPSSDEGGTVYYYAKPANGWANLSESFKILPDDSENERRFGSSLSVSGNIVVVGAHQDDEKATNAGSDYLFEITYSNRVNDIHLSGFRIFPNPTSDYLNILFDNNNTKQICITDITGKIVFQKNCDTITEQLNLESLGKGIFMMTILENQEVLVQKIVKN